MSDKKRILLVEDEEDVREIVVFRLEQAGYDVIAAGDGESGLELAEKEVPNLIFLDLSLPGMKGDEVCLKLKANEKLKAIPVVIFSASVDKVRAKARAVGADDYLVKPWEPEELVAKVRKFLG